MRKQRRRGIALPLYDKTPSVPNRKKWVEMDQTERIEWIEKRQREQEYLDWRNADRKTDRAYRADAPHELDLLAMLTELAEEAAGGGEKREREEE